jgi:isopenicillin N synthase-like dioxygenase
MVLYTEAKVKNDIPIIDLSRSFSDVEAREKAAAQVGAACRDTGFFYVTNHGVDQSVIDKAFVESKRFFEQPLDTKLKLNKKGGANGFEPLETQRLDTESPPDLKESFNFSAVSVTGSPDNVPNQWPDHLPGFRENLERYHQQVRDLGLHVSRLIALSLGMPVNFFDHTFVNQKAALRLLRYPPHPSDAKFNQLGAGAHTDFGWITLLAQDSLGGLEVETASGEWVKVKPVPGAFVINLGDLVRRWTNDRYHSSLHRVMNNKSGKDRYSIVCFYNHTYETPVECLPTCVEPGETPKYERVISGEHRTGRYLAALNQTVE